MSSKHKSDSSSSESSVNADVNPRVIRLFWVFLVLSSAAYLVHTVGPLRLNVDSLTYLSVAASAIDGEGFVDRGEPSQFPPGYPVLIVAFYRLGLAVPHAIGIANIIFMAVAAVVSFRIGQSYFGLSDESACGIGAMIPLSWITVKHATLPMAEMGFMAMTISALYALYRLSSESGTKKRWLWFGISTALVAGSIVFRTIGLTLVIPMSYILMRYLWQRAVRRRSRGQTLGVALGVCAVAAALAIWVISPSQYWADFTRLYATYGAPELLMKNLPWKLLEWGELLANVPRSQLPVNLEIMFLVLGLLGVVLVGGGLYVRRRAFGPVDLYFLIYAGVLAVWPGIDARFWLPVLPLILLYGYIAIRQVMKSRAGLLLIPYLAFYAILGTAALGYSLQISLSGSAFPERYGSGSFKEAYEFAYYGEGSEESAQGRALRLLRRFEHRLHPAAGAPATPSDPDEAPAGARQLSH